MKLFIIVLSLNLIACAPKVTKFGVSESTEEKELSSRAKSSETTDLSLAQSSHCKSTSGNFEANLNVAFYTGTDKIDSNYMKVKFTLTKPLTDNQYIMFYVWGFNDSTKQIINNVNPLEFRYLESTKQTSYLTRISKDNLPSDIQSTSLADLSSLSFKVKGTSTQYDVLQISLYEKSQVTSIDHLDCLMPEFQSDPNQYAENHKEATMLFDLHPLWDMKDNNIIFRDEFSNFKF